LHIEHLADAHLGRGQLRERGLQGHDLGLLLGKLSRLLV
jgi:hypothetical protein